MNKQLAKIKKVDFNIHDRGILTFYVNVDYENGFSQGVGGLCLDEYDEITKRRVGTAYGCEMIRRLMLVLGVDDFEDAKGKIIYVTGDGEGFSFKPTGFETLRVDGKIRELNFAEVYNQFAKDGNL